MLINETSKLTKLTKKAIEYYIEQGLISPVALENGYRDFDDRHIECLQRISVLRKLGLGTEEIKAVLSDKTNSSIQKLTLQKDLWLQNEQKRKGLLERLGKGEDYDSISKELIALEQNFTLTERLLDAFPGYYGRFVCLHFSAFLNAPILSEEQLAAYDEIISFLDNVPVLQFSEELQEYLEQNTDHITPSQINKMTETQKESMKNPDIFLSEYKETLDFYYEYMKSEEYLNSPAYKLKSLLLEFNKSSGYYDVFIPAMKKLSPVYAEYCQNAEDANQKLLELYPELG